MYKMFLFCTRGYNERYLLKIRSLCYQVEIYIYLIIQYAHPLFCLLFEKPFYSDQPR